MKNFEVSIRLTPELYAILMPRDIARLWPKLNMVAQIATDMAEAMLKGNRKYPSDNHSAEGWSDHLISDLTDSLLYAHFLKKRLMSDYEDSFDKLRTGGAQDEADSEAGDAARSEA